MNKELNDYLESIKDGRKNADADWIIKILERNLDDEDWVDVNKELPIIDRSDFYKKRIGFFVKIGNEIDTLEFREDNKFYNLFDEVKIDYWYKL